MRRDQETRRSGKLNRWKKTTDWACQHDKDKSDSPSSPSHSCTRPPRAVPSSSTREPRALSISTCSTLMTRLNGILVEKITRSDSQKHSRKITRVCSTEAARQIEQHHRMITSPGNNSVAATAPRPPKSGSSPISRPVAVPPCASIQRLRLPTEY